MAPMNLDELGIKYGTDKSSREHNYLCFYEELFSFWRDEPVTIVEFGCWTGASLNMFAEFFPRATVVGVEQYAEHVKAEHGNIRVVRGDVMARRAMGELFQEHPPTIIIDDASHKWSDQIHAFEWYFPHLLPGGWYICEDTHTSFGDDLARAFGDQDLDAASYFAILALALCGMRGTKPVPHKLPYGEGHLRLAKFVDRVVFRNHCIAIKKREQVGRRAK